MSEAPPPRPGMIDLARQLVGGVVRLARLEVTHGRQEIGRMLSEAGRGAVYIGIAVGILLLSAVTLDVVIVLGVAALFDVLPNLAVVVIMIAALVALLVLYGVLGGFELLGKAPVWVAVGVVFLLLLVGAAFALPALLGFRADWHSALYVLTLEVCGAPLFIIRGIRRIKVGPPNETIASVKEDIAWAKRLLRRG